MTRTTSPAERALRNGLLRRLAIVVCLATSVAANHATAQSALTGPSPQLQRIFDGKAPRDAADLKQMQAYNRRLADKVINATVHVRVGSAVGSGVIVSADGLILTAAHVVGDPGRVAGIRMADGRMLPGVSLGIHRPLDAGMVQVSVQGDLPYLEIGNSDKLRKGQWCAATGHPGGYSSQRGPVFRLGRILERGNLLRTDCQLAGGDSGGPLINMRGEVIGIHSRIGISLSNNLHIPVDDFREHWEQLVAGKVWKGPAFIGVKGDRTASNATVTFVHEGSPADRAGIEVGDIIVRFAGQRVHSFRELQNVVQLRQPGERVEIELERQGRTKTVDIRVGRRKTREKTTSR